MDAAEGLATNRLGLHRPATSSQDQRSLNADHAGPIGNADVVLILAQGASDHEEECAPASNRDGRGCAAIGWGGYNVGRFSLFYSFSARFFSARNWVDVTLHAHQARAIPLFRLTLCFSSPACSVLGTMRRRLLGPRTITSSSWPW